MEAKLIAGLILLIGIGGLFGWGETERAGKIKLQAQFDEYKLSAASELAAEVAKNTKDREAADANNEGVINDLNSQVQSARSLNAGLSAQLYNYKVRASTLSLPKTGNNPIPADPTISSSDRRLNDALASAITECNINRASQAALIKELTPQL
jgi:hypothetical protein